MIKLRFPEPFTHSHPKVQDINAVLAERMTLGQRAADRVAQIVGSWPFLITQSCLLAVWVILNGLAWAYKWDPYPFILLNLFLSMQAAFTAPIIMMSQNRQAERDRVEAHSDYQVNQKAEVEIRAILDHLTAQDAALKAIYEMLIADQSDDK